MFRRIWWFIRRTASKGKTILATIAATLTVLGIVTFTNFILEEAIQTTMFGTWAAKDAKNWPLLYRGIRIVEGINADLKLVNTSLGWLHPLAWLSYRDYARAADYWIQANKAMIFAHSPETLLGEEIEFVFVYQRAEIGSDRTELFSGNVKVIISEPPAGTEIKVKGRVFRDGTLVVVDGRECEPVK